MNPDLTDVQRTLRRHVLGVVAVAIVLVLVLGGWAATTEFAGAVIAPGQLVVNSNVKKVQHPTVVVVGDLLVQEGGRVHAGDIIARLDDTQARANLAISVKALDENAARAAREEPSTFRPRQFPKELVERVNNPDVAKAIDGERKQFEMRRAGREGKRGQLKERIAQLRDEIRGSESQIESKKKQVDWVAKELVGVHNLWVDKSHPLCAPHGTGTREGKAGRRARTADRGDRTGQGQDHGNGAADSAGLGQQLDTMLPLVRHVMRQTRDRIFHGKTRAQGKVLSLFEPATEVIRKGKLGKPNQFGNMVKLQEAENQIVIDYEVYNRRPSDADLLIPAIEAHQAKLGRPPRLVAADAAFYSAKNDAAAKAMGVKRVCIPNRSSKSRERKREQKKRWFRNGQKWRTGCEGRISVVKRRHGLDRCRYKGFDGMNRWVGLGIIADTVVNIGRAIEKQSRQ